LGLQRGGRGRAIFNSALPVVSAVGHEIDFTISDFVADLRAGSPPVLPRDLTEGVFASCQFISQSASRLRQLLGEHLETKALALKVCNQRLMRVHPRRRLDQWIQRLDEIQVDMADVRGKACVIDVWFGLTWLTDSKESVRPNS
jgi:exodeoxyribonuclease VII large subunit